MAVKLRLTRKGTKKKPFYRIVAADIQAPRDGKFLEAVGTYDPMQNPAVITLKQDRVQYWLEQGATPTTTVKSILKKQSAQSVPA
ncbi:MAG: 30S ribosomal protein S16 [Desulfobacter postgatei]|jgi:small subunit ribosomal protein S16|uniref:30S ribosomal protein S16 n=1 Tax=Desulfobacter TaxID=2289 RepID=UPI000E90F9E7|nr:MULTISPECIES: 30S ribosomal protein S16 [Desulfobacter]MDQ1269546.1 small subunit ribosomal protein [Thermodesulfobacteriota bacterium]MBP8829464.1 30S ribosomal protein S16 [Desulfobacter sp.]MBP9599193.1 30S ribosomal protein S16 [Desulfobacter sp.]MDD4272770.1 30S ribosomal protein S16 [Desulfobacter postgatei]MDX9964452.1 30S ribosomal protein S16 [Desulfobacter postgatei]